MNANDDWKPGWKVTDKDGCSALIGQWAGVRYVPGKKTRPRPHCGPLTVFATEEQAQWFARTFSWQCDYSLKPLNKPWRVCPCRWKPWRKKLSRLPPDETDSPEKLTVALWGRGVGFLCDTFLPKGTRLAREVELLP